MLISVMSSGLRVPQRPDHQPLGNDADDRHEQHSHARQASATLLIVAKEAAAIMPAMTTHSPWAKFIAPVLLNTTLKPQRDESVNAAGADTDDQQLNHRSGVHRGD